MDSIIHKFVLLWAVIDPVGTIPVFIAVTAALKTTAEKNKVALKAIFIAALVLIFFVVAGEILLDAMEIPLPAFQVAGGVVLFLFALTMIFGDSKPEQELGLVEKAANAAVFPLAIPSIASPGAMMAAVLLTDNHRYSLMEQTITTSLILVILLVTLLLMLAANRIVKIIGDTGASVVSRVMGLILSAVAMNAVLSGLFKYYSSINS
ncbi:multiple antibiotic resistance (MarC)-like protein [Catenovulum agarivorans DS-2]|uniref:UPF0056 membrane protein n=1 Tax=Catenovulum agarivorans DS-2 TaxID=1328313 RepID=W7R2R0_9ALTE|nr:MarC family protein [Catenovulum agarivorans]EWH11915.1 multiple antibiotic resistance (MarC)-like protein [Catenovulum agarivorans DS-2]